MESKNKNANVLVQIAAIIGAFAIPIVAIFAIFAKNQMVVSAYIVGALCIMGLGLGSIYARSQGHHAGKSGDIDAPAKH